MKQLYFLHIPKTAGKYISKNIKDSLDKNGIGYFISTQTPNEKSFINKTYISMHAGTYPIEQIPDLEIATLIRNPIDARLSYFNFVYNRFLFNRKEYQQLKSVYDKLKFYLFEDDNMSMHNNYQARFICNPADEKSFSVSSFYSNYGIDMMKPFNEEGKAFTWFVGNENTSLDKAILNLEKFQIVNTVDNIKLFESKISNWFKNNYSIEIEFKKNDIINQSFTDYGNGELITTKDLFSMLSEDDKKEILKVNNIDNFIYELIKKKEENNVFEK